MEISVIDEFKRSWLTSSIGVMLLIAGTWVLTWNERRAVHHSNSLEEAHKNVIAINPYDLPQKEFDGRLVYISAPLQVDEPLTEPEYGVSIQSVKLKRRVQMYQWVEQRVKSDYVDSTSMHDDEKNDYYYVTEWRDKLVDSRSFYIRHGHQNPSSIPLKSHIYVSHLVKVGQLILGSDLKDEFTDYIEVTGDERPERTDIKLHLGIYYHCEDVWNPKVGDIRVQFYYAGVNGETVSVIAMQQDGLLLPYVTRKGHEILLLRQGTLTISQMFNAKKSDLNFETWKLRGLGLMLIYFSCICLARLLWIILSDIGSIRAFAHAGLSSLENFAVALSFSLTIITVAWLVYRPWFEAALMMAVCSPFLYCAMNVYNVAQHHN